MEDIAWDLLLPSSNPDSKETLSGWAERIVKVSQPPMIHIPRVHIHFVVKTSLAPHRIGSLAEHVIRSLQNSLASDADGLRHVHQRWAMGSGPSTNGAHPGSRRRLLLLSESIEYTRFRSRLDGVSGTLSLPPVVVTDVEGLDHQAALSELEKRTSGAEGSQAVHIFALDRFKLAPELGGDGSEHLSQPSEGRFLYLVGGTTICPVRDEKTLEALRDKNIILPDGSFAPFEWACDGACEEPTGGLPPHKLEAIEPGPIG